MEVCQDLLHQFEAEGDKFLDSIITGNEMKEGCRLSDIHRRLQNIYGDDTFDRSNVHRWMNFKEEKTSIEDKPRSGKPSTTITGMNRQRVDELICAEK
jgi:hypothetical protein